MSYIAYHEQKQAQEAPKPKTYTLEDLANRICASYDECPEECPGFQYCRIGTKGTLTWLRKVVEQ